MGQGRELEHRGCLLLALVLGELPVLDQHKKTSAASVGLLVGPFVHAEFALHKEFLTFLDQFAKIFGGFSPDLKVDEGRYLLFLTLSVGIIFVVSEGGRENGFAGWCVAQFRVSGEVAGDEDSVDVHNSDLGFQVGCGFCDFVNRRFNHATCSI